MKQKSTIHEIFHIKHVIVYLNSFQYFIIFELNANIKYISNKKKTEDEIPRSILNIFENEKKYFTET